MLPKLKVEPETAFGGVTQMLAAIEAVKAEGRETHGGNRS